MNASAAAKSPAQNRLEGFALAAILQGFPTFAMAVLLVKLTHGHEFVTKVGAATFVMLATLIYALLISWLAATFPRTFAVHGEGRALARKTRDLAATADDGAGDVAGGQRALGSPIVIPGRAKREPQMRNCASGNLEIPGLVLRTIPE